MCTVSIVGVIITLLFLVELRHCVHKLRQTRHCPAANFTAQIQNILKIRVEISMNFLSIIVIPRVHVDVWEGLIYIGLYL